MTFDAFIVTCEHATNAVPVRWREPFADTPEVLETHRAWDPGALVLAGEFSRQTLGVASGHAVDDQTHLATAQRVDSDHAVSTWPIVQDVDPSRVAYAWRNTAGFTNDSAVEGAGDERLWIRRSVQRSGWWRDRAACR
jgi:hypothetical protein